MAATIRQQVGALAELGPLPSEDATEDRILTYEQILALIEPPVSDDEARVLVRLFGNDDSFGLAWSLVHLIETAPGWPLRDCFQDAGNEWIRRLQARAEGGSR
jgi:hypothetical protein